MKNDQLLMEPNGAPIVALEASQGLADRRDLSMIALERTRMPIAVTDPRLPDNPIVLANQAFLTLCGYAADEVVGRNCRFLQGPATDRAAVAHLKEAIEAEQEVEIELLNYRKDGSTFWNKVFVSPIHNEAGELVYFFASQKDETAKRRALHLEEVEQTLLREVDHRTKNALALIQSVVLLSKKTDVQTFAASIEARVGSIVRSHVLLADHNWAEVPLRKIIEIAIIGGTQDAVELSGSHTALPAALVQPLGLIFHELFDNAIKHGALSAPAGLVGVKWTFDDSCSILTIVMDECHGPAPSRARSRGLGIRLIEQVVQRQLRGTVKTVFKETGLRTTLIFSLA